MRIQDIFEMPQLMSWELDRTKLHNRGYTFMSFKAVDRLYDMLDTSKLLIINNTPVYIALSKKHYMCSAFVKNIKPETDEPALQLISQVSFYHQPGPFTKLPTSIKNPLQVSNVFTEPEWENRGVAQFMYATLVRHGFTIVSDRVQYLGGKELWQAMVRKAHLKDYSITIYNEDAGFVKDSSGIILNYNASNIDDSVIWKTSDIGRKTVLILSPKIS